MNDVRKKYSKPIAVIICLLVALQLGCAVLNYTKLDVDGYEKCIDFLANWNEDTVPDIFYPRIRELYIVSPTSELFGFMRHGIGMIPLFISIIIIPYVVKTRRKSIFPLAICEGLFALLFLANFFTESIQRIVPQLSRLWIEITNGHEVISYVTYGIVLISTILFLGGEIRIMYRNKRSH